VKQRISILCAATQLAHYKYTDWTIQQCCIIYVIQLCVTIIFVYVSRYLPGPVYPFIVTDNSLRSLYMYLLANITHTTEKL